MATETRDAVIAITIEKEKTGGACFSAAPRLFTNLLLRRSRERPFRKIGRRFAGKHLLRGIAASALLATCVDSVSAETRRFHASDVRDAAVINVASQNHTLYDVESNIESASRRRFNVCPFLRRNGARPTRARTVRSARF